MKIRWKWAKETIELYSEWCIRGKCIVFGIQTFNDTVSWHMCDIEFKYLIRIITYI